MGSIPVGSTKKQTQMCLLLLSRLGIEGRRSVVPIPVRSTGSLIYGSTKNDCEDGRFYMMKRKSGRFRTHKGFSEISFDK